MKIYSLSEYSVKRTRRLPLVKMKQLLKITRITSVKKLLYFIKSSINIVITVDSA